MTDKAAPKRPDSCPSCGSPEKGLCRLECAVTSHPWHDTFDTATQQSIAELIAWHNREATLTTSVEAAKWHREQAQRLTDESAACHNPAGPAPLTAEENQDARGVTINSNRTDMRPDLGNRPHKVAPPLTESPQPRKRRIGTSFEDTGTTPFPGGSYDGPAPTDSHAQGTRYFCGICGGTSEPCTHQRELAHAQGTTAATEPRRTYCHLCRSYFEGAPDGHGLGECVELCEICLQNQADIDTRDVGKTTPCAPCRRVLQLAEALRAMLDIAPFAKNTPDAEIHGRAEVALNDRLLGEGK
jgi:hypothetical protein